MATNNNGFAKALNGFAVVLSLGATVFVGPAIWPAIHEPVWHALVERYSLDTARLLYWIGEIATYPLMYFAIRVALGVLIFVINEKLNRHHR